MHRRRLVAALAAAAALGIQRAHAQSLIGTECTLGFVSGLLQFNLECVITPAGSGLVVAPPTHLVSLTQALDAADSADADLKPPQSGSRRRRKKARLRKRRHHKNGGGTKTTTSPLDTTP